MDENKPQFSELASEPKMTKSQFLELVSEQLSFYTRTEANWWLSLSIVADQKYEEFFARKGK